MKKSRIVNHTTHKYVLSVNVLLIIFLLLIFCELQNKRILECVACQVALPLLKLHHLFHSEGRGVWPYWIHGATGYGDRFMGRNQAVCGEVTDRPPENAPSHTSHNLQNRSSTRIEQQETTAIHKVCAIISSNRASNSGNLNLYLDLCHPLINMSDRAMLKYMSLHC